MLNFRKPADHFEWVCAPARYSGIRSGRRLGARAVSDTEA